MTMYLLVLVTSLGVGAAVKQDGVLPPGAEARLGTTRTMHGAGIPSMAWSLDSNLLASSGHDGYIRIWNARGGSLKLSLGDFKEPLTSVAFSSKSPLLFAASANGTVIEVDINTWREARRIPPGVPIESIRMLPNGLLLARRNGDIALWDVEARRAVLELQGIVSDVSPDGTMLAVGRRDGIVTAASIRTGAILLKRADHAGKVQSVVVSSDGCRVASGDDDGAVRVVDVPSGKLLTTLKQPVGTVRALAFSPNGKRLISCQVGGPAVLWDLEESRIIRECRVPNGGAFEVRYSPDGNWIAFSGLEGNLSILSAEAKEFPEDKTSHHATITSVAFLGNLNRLVSMDADGKGVWWSAQNWQAMGSFGSSSNKGVWNILPIPPSGRFVTAGPEDSTRVWDGAGVDVKCLSEGPIKGIVDLAYLPGIDRVVAATMDRALITLSSDLKVAIKHNWTEVATTAVDGRGTRVAGGQADGNVFLLDLNTGATATAYSYGKHESVRDLAFLDEGRTLACLWSDGIVRVLNLVRGSSFYEINPHENMVSCITRSLDNRLFAVGLRSGAVQVFETWTGTRLAEYSGHTGPVSCLAFSPNSMTLVSGSVDQTLLVWSLFQSVENESMDLENLWATLGAKDGPSVLSAQRALLARSMKDGLDAWSARLEIPEFPDLNESVGDLDHDDPVRRERAFQRLMSAGWLAEAGLRRAMGAQPAPERKAALTRLLSALDSFCVQDTGLLRRLRAIAVLEWSKHERASEVLEKLSRQASLSRVGREAGYALARRATLK